MKVPFVDLSLQYQEIQKEVFDGIQNVCQRGAFILGQEEKDFEAEFAKYCHSQYGVGLNSGTDALYLALSALDIGPGDEVVLPTHTFIATALCVSYTGATPVFADSEDGTFNIDPRSFEKAITKKTKAVLPVHIYGQPADMAEIVAIAHTHGITVIEDAAQAHGAVYKNERVGALGDIACFSFYPTKNLGAFGDGGMVITKRQDIYEKVMMLRDYGRKGRYEHIVKGYNTRLDTVQAVALSAKLKRLDQWNRMRQQVAAWYQDELAGVSGVRLPKVGEDRSHVYHLYVVRVAGRDRVLERLNEEGVGSLIHYPIPVHLQPAYQDAGYKKGDFPVAEQIASEIISLPMFPHMSREQVKGVADVLKKILKGA
ncbi:MAG TPA: DegT/DnrJ/EryC1/StrS family aminotransferase [Candidatus Omnitrophota bacterium]|nr:DegT/DnrJ/EryC1/StrS family aminotransferase [Candidatus Omnitrophota bacterium]